MNIEKTFTALLAVALLASCSGAGSSTTGMSIIETPASPTPTEIGLGDTSNSSSINVEYLTISGVQSGTFVPNSGFGLVSGASVGAIAGTINNRFSYVRLIDDASVAFVPATGTIPAGDVRYLGYAVMIVTDVANNAQFDGVADARLDVDFSGFETGILDLTSFSGTRQDGPNAPVAVSSGRLTVEGLGAESAGLSGGTHVSNVEFGSGVFADATIEINSAFAGPDYSEVAGAVRISATDGFAQISFAASQ